MRPPPGLANRCWRRAAAAAPHAKALVFGKTAADAQGKAFFSLSLIVAPQAKASSVFGRMVAGGARKGARVFSPAATPRSQSRPLQKRLFAVPPGGLKQKEALCSSSSSSSSSSRRGSITNTNTKSTNTAAAQPPPTPHMIWPVSMVLRRRLCPTPLAVVSQEERPEADRGECRRARREGRDLRAPVTQQHRGERRCKTTKGSDRK